jgi:hypothetical protein
MHSTNNINDNYVGSGKRLWYEIRKYGKENFKIYILNYYNNREELINAEKILITENDINNNNCLNLISGGTGFSTQSSILANEKKNKMWTADIEWREAYSQSLSLALKKVRNNLTRDQLINISEKIKQGQIRVNFNHATFKGKKHSEETKQKMSEIKKETTKGKNNSQYNTMWITNGTINKKIKKPNIIPYGWKLGRILKR